MISILDKQVYKPLVVIPKAGDAIRLWEEVGAEVYVFPFTTFWTSTGPRCLSRENIKQQRALFSNKKLRDFILSLQPDLIHINDKAALQAGISLRKSTIPIIQHSRSAYAITACKWNKWISPRMIRKYASHIICISEDEIQGFEDAPNKAIVYNMVDMDKAQQARSNRAKLRKELKFNEYDIVIGMAEHLNKHKGSIALLELLYQLCVVQKRKNIRILLVGEQTQTDIISFKQFTGSTKKVLQAFIAAHQLEHVVVKVGYQPNALEYIAAMDILVVAKLHGVLGRQPLEAQSVGTTVVALNGQSGKSSIIKHGTTGFLVSTFEELLSKTELFIDQQETLHSFKASALLYAQKHFSEAAYAEKLSSIYNQFLNA